MQSFGKLLKSSLRNLIVDHQREQSRSPAQLAPGHGDPAYEQEVMLASDLERSSALRHLLLFFAEEQLAADDLSTGQNLATLWRLHRAHPLRPSEELAMEFSASVGRPHSPRWVRKWLPLTREQLADTFVANLDTALEHPSLANREVLLMELGLQVFCRNALARRAAQEKMCC